MGRERHASVTPEGRRRRTRPPPAARRLSWAALCLVLSGCGTLGTGNYLEGDGGPSHPPADVAAIPNAVPTVAPRSEYGNPAAYTVDGRTYHVLKDSRGYVKRGVASWYGIKFHERRTASGEPYDMYAMTAAHKTLPLPTYVQVTNLSNGNKVIVKVNDRGPFLHNRLIDLSYAAAAKLGMLATGTAPVEVRAIDPRQYARRQRRRQQAHPIAKRAKVALYLQVGAFTDRHNAERLRTDLKSISGDRVRITPVRINAHQQVYRVRIGPLPDVDHADRLVDTLSQHGIKDADLIVD